jgi:hypothetical protein
LIFDRLAALEPDECVTGQNQGNQLEPDPDSDIEKRKSADKNRKKNQ